ncbi:MAG: S41 family peptidase [Gemmataceae bacterium]|nr:S41 family peptidase [Gemmataceae bacterium]
MNGEQTPWGRSLGIVVLLVGAFAAGGMAERLGLLPGSASEPADAEAVFKPFWQAWRLARHSYVERDAADPIKMTRGAIRGMLASLGDVGHTGYLSPEEYRELKEGLEGEFEGIGAHVTMRQRRPTIMQVIPDSPAQEAGLKAGDVILEVDGKSVADLPLERVVQKVRGPAGTQVKLLIAREGVSKALTVPITRRRVDLPSVTWQRLEGKPIGHVAIRTFGRQADEQLRAAVEQLRQRGVKGLILDLRGNPGGLKEQAVAVSSEFLKSGNVFLEQDAEGNRTPVPVRPGGTITDLPLIVLIDEGTASSAEILAGAIQDHKRGQLVGTRTFGTGTVLQPFRLSDGSAVLLAVRQWLTPNGRKIWHEGITPDVVVPLPENATVLLPVNGGELSAAALARSDDAQFRKALEILEAQLR